MQYLSRSPVTVLLCHIRLGVRLEGRHPTLRRTGIDNDRLARSRAAVVRRPEERCVEPSSSLLEIPHQRTTSLASRVMPRQSLSRRTRDRRVSPRCGLPRRGSPDLSWGARVLWHSVGCQRVRCTYGVELVHGCLSDVSGTRPRRESGARGRGHLHERRRVTPSRLSGRGESHPPALSEPDVSLSVHPAPIIQRQGSTPICQWAKRAGERRATSSSHLHDRLGWR
jgi:hypothetical protein